MKYNTTTTFIAHINAKGLSIQLPMDIHDECYPHNIALVRQTLYEELGKSIVRSEFETVSLDNGTLMDEIKYVLETAFNGNSNQQDVSCFKTDKDELILVCNLSTKHEELAYTNEKLADFIKELCNDTAYQYISDILNSTTSEYVKKRWEIGRDILNNNMMFDVNCTYIQKNNSRIRGQYHNNTFKWEELL